MGLKVREGGDLREAGIKPEGYMHNMLNPEVAYTWATDGFGKKAQEYDKLYIKHQMAKGSTEKEAIQMLHEYKGALGF